VSDNVEQERVTTQVPNHCQPAQFAWIRHWNHASYDLTE
jgi:hypothetical protein